MEHQVMPYYCETQYLAIINKHTKRTNWEESTSPPGMMMEVVVMVRRRGGGGGLKIDDAPFPCRR
jgi:hypothetical protein